VFPDYQKARIDPAAVFSRPVDVVAETRLTRDQKIDILRHWEYDARETLVAVEENMHPEKRTDLLSQVLEALHLLDAGIDTEHAPPTKQGGV